MLEIVGLEKSFQGRRVLSGLDLRVSPGESVALLGGNGSGKTTTLRAIAGLVIPDAGTIRVDGLDAVGQGKRARRCLSFLPQKSVFPATLSVRETLQVAARLRGQPEEDVAAELEHCELADLAGRSVAELSGGERQRLGLAVAFLARVGLYLFDEPTASLDPRALEIFRRRARNLADHGRAVLFTTHVAADVETLATRVELLEEGRLASSKQAAFFPRAAARMPGGAVLSGPWRRGES
ncbi:MAG TPA: ABC transporter ATP-binding protein [Thermoanaerobaculia bacterium]|nr:ABC transporter ATP-binding protein [Thermoanaerobaculia bacterium]